MQGQGDVLHAGQRGQEIEELEDEADLVAAQAGEVVVGQVGDGLAVDADLAGAGTIEPADQIEERGFAGAGGPDDGDHLAARDLEIDRFERGHLALAVVDLGDTGEGNHPGPSMIAWRG